MPLIDRATAVATITDELGEPSCLICALRDGTGSAPFLLAESPHALAVLARYGLGPGHAIVILWEHGVYALDDDEGATLTGRLAAHLPPLSHRREG